MSCWRFEVGTYLRGTAPPSFELGCSRFQFWSLIMTTPKIPKKHMFDSRLGVALFDPWNAGTVDIPTVGMLDLNAKFIDQENNVLRAVALTPRPSMKSYFVNIEVDNGEVFIVCFRGVKYRVDRETSSAEYISTYDKY
jgi:hypothetical protein